jgi:hypothetical protein
MSVRGELLANRANIDVIGDKGYISAEVAARLLR